MAMTKEQQREAARRILQKEPLTAEEQETFELLKRNPEDYRPPMQEYRKCERCGAEFRTDGNLTAMQKFADHQSVHNSSPSQWATAHKRIEAGKEKQKERDKAL